MKKVNIKKPKYKVKLFPLENKKYIFLPLDLQSIKSFHKKQELWDKNT